MTTVREEAPRRFQTIVALAASALLVLALVVRNEFPLPARVPPAALGVTVASGSSGIEGSGLDSFWTVDHAVSELRVTNASAAPLVASVRFRLVGGPCTIEREVELSTPTSDRTISLPPNDSVDVSVDDLHVESLSSELITLNISGGPCAPIGNDPRAIYIQIFSLGVSDQTAE